MAEPPRRFVLLDRDGTVIVDKNYLADHRQVELMPLAAEGLRRMRQMGLGLLVVSNQSGVGRGYFGLAELERVHARMSELLKAQGIELDGIYFCPHAPEEACACRKPQTGLAERAAAELGFDPASCFVIGDQDADMGLGRALKAKTILVRTGNGTQAEADGAAAPDYVANDLLEAASLIARLL